jgi:hypothetical protein
MVANVLQLSAASLSALRIQVRKMRAALIAADFESAAVKSTAINDVEEIITKLEFLMDADSGDFRLVVRRQDAASRQRSAVAGASPPMPSVHFTCLLGAVALKPLREATRCMLFASGTLGPPILLTSELALGDNCVAVRFSDMRLLCVYITDRGPPGVHGAPRHNCRAAAPPRHQQRPRPARLQPPAGDAVSQSRG